MTRKSKITLAVAFIILAVASISTVATFVHPRLASTGVIDTDHYVQDLRAQGIWYKTPIDPL